MTVAGQITDEQIAEWLAYEGDLALHAAVGPFAMRALLTELQHRREAEAGTDEDRLGRVARLIEPFAFDVDPPRKKDSEAKEAMRLEALATAARVLAFLTASPSSPASKAPDIDMALHWIDRYAAGIDEEPQMSRILDALGVEGQT